MPTMLRPSSVIAPPSGRNAPVTRLMVVVLPEPFGPIRPTISPRCRSAEKPATAAMPPKCLFSALATKYGASGAGIFALLRPRFCRFRRRAPVEIAFDERKETVLREALHQDQREAERHEAPFAVVA